MEKKYFLALFAALALFGGLQYASLTSAQKADLSEHIVQNEAPDNQTVQPVPFIQNWTNTGQITTNDDWSGVPGIEGYLGQDITVATGTDPQTLLTTSALPNDLDVIANQTSPDTNTSGGVGEFEITNPVVALQGSGTADAPYVIFYLNTTGLTNINVAYNLRDIDGSIDNSIQPVALQYRVGSTGNFTNVAAGFVSDASSGPSLATLVTPVAATLGADANNQALVQVRIMTTNAVGSDEWIGVDDISVTGVGGGGGPTGGPRAFRAYMNSANEVPPNGSTATGFGRIFLNEAQTQITASFYWSGLTGNATAGHIHGPAAPGATGPVIFDMAPSATTSGSAVNRTFTVNAAQVADLKAGLWYFNIHTTANPNGEIRGQILRTKPRMDVDADGDSDWSVVRPGAGGASGQLTWYTVVNTGTPTDPFTITQFGLNSDVITPADFDGDGKTDLAFWRPTGTPAFFILRSTTGTVQQVTFGLNGDDPSIVADYSGDGKADPAIYRPGATSSSQSFFWTFPSSGQFQNVQVVQPWGLGSDVAVPGDYDGDGKADLCVARNVSNQNVYIVYSSQNVVSYTPFGIAAPTADNLAPGDYDGDGITDFAITRIEGGNLAWWIKSSRTGTDSRIGWGVSGDVEAQGDYDGDGLTDPTIWRPSGGSTFTALTNSGVKFQRWGLATDSPSIYDIH